MAGELLRHVTTIVNELFDTGWGELLNAESGRDTWLAPNMTPEAMGAALALPLPTIRRKTPGFEDFCALGRPEDFRGIAPGSPARSLLFHALASPAVRCKADGHTPLERFPTPDEIQTVLNYVYSVPAARLAESAVPSLKTVRERVPASAVLALAVFAEEYRPADADVPHGQYADMCYARTGIARVGTRPPLYLPEDRGWTLSDPAAPLPQPGGPEASIAVPIHAVPVRYGVYLATQRAGAADILGSRYLQDGDDGLGFWAPLHRLFDGDECLEGMDISVVLTPQHINRKLAAYHAWMNERSEDISWKQAALKLYPFTFTDGIADFQPTTPVDANGKVTVAVGKGLLTPVPHPLTEPAKLAHGGTVTFPVPRRSPDEAAHFILDSTLRIYRDDDPTSPDYQVSSLTINASQVNGAPTYINARHQVLRRGDKPDGTSGDPELRDLNNEVNVANIVKAGGYEAQHYIDYTGDGFVTAACSALTAAGIARIVPAYSIIAQPDFYPRVSQRFLADFAASLEPPPLQSAIWRVPPQSLADARVPANQTLPPKPFRYSDLTVTAVVTAPPPTGAPSPPPAAPADLRTVDAGGPAHQNEMASWRRTRMDPFSDIRPMPNREYYSDSGLPDDAAGLMAPGWDITVDRQDNPEQDGGVIEFLAAYGLGSPFLEDTRICAALSAFWVAAAPDTSRTYALNTAYGTIAPLSDAEIGTDPDAARIAIKALLASQDTRLKAKEKKAIYEAAYAVSDRTPSGRGWDGVAGPALVALRDFDGLAVRVASAPQVDYVVQGRQNRFDPRRLSRVGPREYAARILIMARVYRALGIDMDWLPRVGDRSGAVGASQLIEDGPLGQGKAAIHVLEFRPVVEAVDVADREAALKDTVDTLALSPELKADLRRDLCAEGGTFVHVHQPDVSAAVKDPRFLKFNLIPYQSPTQFFVGRRCLLLRDGGPLGPSWQLQYL